MAFEALALERGPAAIAAADVEGRPHLLHIDEERTRAALAAHREISATAGDRVLAVSAPRSKAGA